MLEKGQIHLGMLLAVFAVNESQKRRTRPPYHRQGAGRQHQNLNFRHGAVAPRLTDRSQAQHNIIRQTAAHQQHSSSSAVAAPQPQPEQQQQRRRGRGRRWRWRWPRQMSCGTAARPGSITTIITTTTEQPVFYYYFCKQTQETPTAAPAQQPPHSSSSSSSSSGSRSSSSCSGGGRAEWVAVAVEALATALWDSDGGCDKICTEYDVTQQQRPRSHRRERGSAGSLAPAPEVARTRHASPATFGASASMLGCVYRCQAQRTAISAVCCRMGCALVPSDCCAGVPGVGRPIVRSGRY